MVQPRISSPKHVPRNLVHQGPTDADWYTRSLTAATEVYMQPFGIGQGDSARPFEFGQRHPAVDIVGFDQVLSELSKVTRHKSFGLSSLGRSIQGVGQSHSAISVGLGQSDPLNATRIRPCSFRHTTRIRPGALGRSSLEVCQYSDSARMIRQLIRTRSG